MLIDTHAHLQWQDYKDDFETMLENAKRAGVELILNVGTTVKTSEEAIQIAERFDHIYATVGIHPHDSKEADAASISTLKELAKHPKVMAIGEMGLDFFYEHSPKEKQIEVFEKQLEIAKELELPVSIHCREAFSAAFASLKKIKIKRGVFHCFTGTERDAKEAAQMGFYISISGIVTFKKSAGLQDVVKSIPLEHLMIETDCPFLAPEPYRGKRNEPAYIVETARKVAALKNIPLETVAKMTTENAKALFKF
jgi:TatD DNase family protein